AAGAVGGVRGLARATGKRAVNDPDDPLVDRDALGRGGALDLLLERLVQAERDAGRVGTAVGRPGRGRWHGRHGCDRFGGLRDLGDREVGLTPPEPYVDGRGP